MAISRPERPGAGMYLLDEDLAMDATKKRAVLPSDPAARFVLGGAGTEVSRVVVDRLTNVEVTDRRVRLQKGKAVSEPGPESTGPVPATPDRGSTVDEGPTISTAALDRGEGAVEAMTEATAPPKADADKKADKKS